MNSFDVSGLRRTSEPSREEVSPGEAYGIADSPGKLTVSADLTNDDLERTVAGSMSFEVRAATAPIVSSLRRPPPFKGHRGWTCGPQTVRFRTRSRSAAAGPTR